MGSKEIGKLGWRESWAFVGVLGEKSCTEQRGNKNTQATVSKSFDLGEGIGAKYIGCYKDKSARDLKEFLGNLSPDACFEKAKARNFKFYGLQSGGQCRADNDYGKYGQMKDWSCNMKCTKDKTQNCGAKWMNSVYKIA